MYEALHLGAGELESDGRLLVFVGELLERCYLAMVLAVERKHGAYWALGCSIAVCRIF